MKVTATYISVFKEGNENVGQEPKWLQFCDAHPRLTLLGISLCGSLITLVSYYLYYNGASICREAVQHIGDIIK